jgi:hypothetical protein
MPNSCCSPVGIMMDNNSFENMLSVPKQYANCTLQKGEERLAALFSVHIRKTGVIYLFDFLKFKLCR